MRIPERHELTRDPALCEGARSGAPAARAVEPGSLGLPARAGRAHQGRGDARARYPLGPAEKDKTPDELWAATIGARLEALNDHEKADLWAEAAGLTQEAIDPLASVNGLGPELPTAVTEVLREEVRELWSHRFDEIVGGTDRLPAAFVEQLRSKPRLGCEVIAIEQDLARRRAVAIYREGKATSRAEGDFVLCTLPFPVLSRLRIDKTFSGSKQRAIRQLNYDSSTRRTTRSRPATARASRSSISPASIRSSHNRGG